jgi:hypothetical protein
MKKFADLTENLRRRALSERLIRMLDALEILDGLPDDGGKKTHVRLPYSSDPRSLEERWK